MYDSLSRNHPTVPETIRLMLELHREQRDKAGEPYWRHPYRVMQRLRPIESQVLAHAALLHDVVEDCRVTLQDLEQRGYDPNVVEAINLVTRFKDGRDRDKTHLEWIDWIGAGGNIAAMLVKYADMLDNSAPARMAMLPERHQALAQRYGVAMVVLVPYIPSELRSRVIAGDMEISVSDAVIAADKHLIATHAGVAELC